MHTSNAVIIAIDIVLFIALCIQLASLWSGKNYFTIIRQKLF